MKVASPDGPGEEGWSRYRAPAGGGSEAERFERRWRDLELDSGSSSKQVRSKPRAWS